MTSLKYSIFAVFRQRNYPVFGRRHIHGNLLSTDAHRSRPDAERDVFPIRPAD